MNHLRDYKRELGKTGMLVSPIGLGTVKLGRSTGVKYPDSFTIPDDSQATALLGKAAELGINLLDTAPAYGNSEQRLGKLLQGQRDRWVLCSKAGEEFDPDNGKSRYAFSPTALRSSVELSLQRLNTDYIDLVLIHSDGNDLEIINRYQALETLNTLKKEGKVRATGMSTKTVEGGILAARYSDCVMVTWHPGYHEEVPVIDFCATHHKGVLIKKALASGHLERGQLESGQLERGHLESDSGTGSAAADPVTRSLRMILAHEGVSSIIIGTINPHHLEANVEAALSALA